MLLFICEQKEPIKDFPRRCGPRKALRRSVKEITGNGTVSGLNVKQQFILKPLRGERGDCELKFLQSVWFDQKDHPIRKFAAKFYGCVTLKNQDRGSWVLFFTSNVLEIALALQY